MIYNVLLGYVLKDPQSWTWSVSLMIHDILLVQTQQWATMFYLDMFTNDP